MPCVTSVLVLFVDHLSRWLKTTSNIWLPAVLKAFRDRAKFIRWNGLWKRKILSEISARPIWNYCKANPLPCHPSNKKMFLSHIHKQQVLSSTINEAIAKQFFSLRVLVDEKLNLEDEEILLKNRYCKQLTRKLQWFYTLSFQAFLFLHDLQFWTQNEQSYVSNIILSL